MDWFLVPFAWLMRTFNAWTGHYLLAILLFAILMKILLLPFGISQQKRQIKSAKLRPKIALIEKKYAGRTDRRTMEKKQQEIMALQQAEGYSPLSGCLPMILQMVLIIVLYGIIQNPLTHICQFDATTIQAIKDAVAAADPSFEIKNEISLFAVKELWQNLPEVAGKELPNFSIGILDFSRNPNIAEWPMAILPFLVFAIQFGTMKVTRIFMGNDPTRMQGNDRNTKISNWIMDLMMPAMSLWFAFILPGALGVYWIYQGLLGLLQSFTLAKVMPLPTYTEEDIKEYERLMKGKVTKVENDEDRPKVRSLHHIDDDDDEEVPAVTPPAKQEQSTIEKAPLKDDNSDKPKGN